MGYNTYTTTDLISDIKILGHVPISQSTFDNATLLKLSTLEMQTPLMNQIMSTRGNYYLTYEDFAATQDGLYELPGDAVGGALFNIQLVQVPTIIPVNPIEPAEQFSTDSPTSTSYGFFMQGNLIQILPTPSIGVCRLWYIKRTSTLVQTSQCAQVVSIAGNDVTVSSVPSNIVNGALVDLVGDQPPFNILLENEITAIAGTTITLDVEPVGLQVGDWICLHQQTCVPQIPAEFRYLLAQRVVVKINELQGYEEKLAASQQKLMELEKAVFGMMTPRVKAQTKIIMPVNGGFFAGNPNRITNFPASRS